MAREFTARRTIGGIIPVDMVGFEVFESLSMGRDLIVSVVEPRNPDFHRMFFGALQHLFKHRDDYSVFDEFRKDVTIKLGHYTMETVRGKLKPIAKSISFGNMDEISFRELFTKFEQMATGDDGICPDMPPSEIAVFWEIIDGNQGKLGNRVA
ncbi:MAG: hypothetical protein COB36_11440 [Alphaproteobacteria bacterium]|nr:MAG: hypothetical protein COB36_11440 [Alphaproteobacteria bacterium]